MLNCTFTTAVGIKYGAQFAKYVAFTAAPAVGGTVRLKTVGTR